MIAAPWLCKVKVFKESGSKGFTAIHVVDGAMTILNYSSKEFKGRLFGQWGLYSLAVL